MFSIDKNAAEPVYIQLSCDIREKIRRNELVSGFRMPAERELAEQLGISRGTVKKAYEILIKEKILNSVHGSGTYVLSSNSQNQLNAKERILELINYLNVSGYSNAEIESMFSIALSGRNTSKMKVAAVDCNKETLKIVEKQLRYMNLSFEHFLLEDVMDFKKSDEVFGDFDLIFTTLTHYKILESLLPKSSKEGKITRIVLSADFETITDISRVGHISKGEMGVITKSKRFADIIEYNLHSFDISIDPSDRLLINDVDETGFKKFIETRKCIIMPPLYTLSIDNEKNNLLLNYYKDGGKIIIFNYIIEKGSLLHLEEFTSKGV